MLAKVAVVCRGGHPAKIGPLELKPVVPGAAGFMQAEVQVPHDASVLDMVFSDSSGGSGSFYDSNHGLGYHVPLRGSRVPQPSLSICHISVEMAPIAKVSCSSWQQVVKGLLSTMCHGHHTAHLVLALLLRLPLLLMAFDLSCLRFLRRFWSAAHVDVGSCPVPTTWPRRTCRITIGWTMHSASPLHAPLRCCTAFTSETRAAGTWPIARPACRQQYVGFRV